MYEGNLVINGVPKLQSCELINKIINIVILWDFKQKPLRKTSKAIFIPKYEQ